MVRWYLRLFTAPANKWAWERWLVFGSAATCFAAAFFSGSLWLLFDACFTKALWGTELKKADNNGVWETNKQTNKKKTLLAIPPQLSYSIIVLATKFNKMIKKEYLKQACLKRQNKVCPMVKRNVTLEHCRSCDVACAGQSRNWSTTGHVSNFLALLFSLTCTIRPNLNRALVSVNVFSLTFFELN